MDFKFIQNPASRKWVILAPRRSKRPDVAVKSQPVCPFCPGREKVEPDIFRVGGAEGDSNWQTRVVVNKFPFAPVHELIIHSPDHHKNFDELPLSQVELILKIYRKRFNAYKEKGQIYIFHNRGEGGGESLPHPHTQLVVVPYEVELDISASVPQDKILKDSNHAETEYFLVFCPQDSQWPDEVWIEPKETGKEFGDISDIQIQDLSSLLSRLIQIFDLRHGHEFPFNFYIYPKSNWYLRLIPRAKTLGGFEIGTGIFVNTQYPNETIAFIKEHLEVPNEEKIKKDHQASYRKMV